MTEELEGTGSESQDQANDERSEAGKDEQESAPTLTEIQAELERTQAALKAANSEAAARRIKLKEFEEAEAERRKAEMSELEQAQATAQEWEGKYNQVVAQIDELQMRQAFYDAAEAAEVTFANAQARKDAFDLSDLSPIEIGDGIDSKAMGKVVKALEKSHPHLFGQAPKPDINAGDAGKGKREATDAEVQEFAARMGLDPRYVDKSLVTF